MREKSPTCALPSSSRLLRGFGGDAGSAEVTAIPEHGGGARGADQEQDERSVDGSRGRVQQTAAARQEVFPRAAGPTGRSAGIGEGYAAVESKRLGNVRRDATAATGPATKRSLAGQTGGTATQCLVATGGSGGKITTI